MSETKRNYYLSCDKDLPSILPDNKLANHVNAASNYIKQLEEQLKEKDELIVKLKKDTDDHFKVSQQLYKNIDLAIDEIAKKDEKIKQLTQFIVNGYNYGYIEIMPIDEDDSAYNTFVELFGEKEAKRIKRECSE
jgi:hypothetical protein